MATAHRGTTSTFDLHRMMRPSLVVMPRCDPCDVLCLTDIEVLVEVYVGRLRKKLDRVGVRIETVRGLGYRMDL